MFNTLNIGCKMDTRYAEKIQELWELAGEIGALAEFDERYSQVYEALAKALDIAENTKLIEYEDEV